MQLQGGNQNYDGEMRQKQASERKQALLLSSQKYSLSDMTQNGGSTRLMNNPKPDMCLYVCIKSCGHGK